MQLNVIVTVYGGAIDDVFIETTEAAALARFNLITENTYADAPSPYQAFLDDLENQTGLWADESTECRWYMIEVPEVVLRDEASAVLYPSEGE